MSVVLSVKNLICGYGGDDIINGISFDVNSGESVSVSGKNGCGKTTLLRCICGIIPKKSGEILIDGQNTDNLKPSERARLVAMFSQTSASETVSAYTVRDTVLMGRFCHRNGIFSSITQEDISIAEDCMRRTGALPLADKYINELSGGQLQRVLLARTFAQQPKLILLDEPANHIDLSGLPELISMIREWTEDGGAIVGVFHDLNLCAAASDRLILMDNGKIAADGSCKDVLKSNILSHVYGFDVQSYMRKIAEIWE